jgi:methylated-DNA-protein-cysteine methyltransferase-like protein
MLSQQIMRYDVRVDSVPMSMTAYQESILNVVRIIPYGKVASYGQVAAYIGTPRAARQVGWAMNSLDGAEDFPWWRVLNNAGVITTKNSHFDAAQLQKELLESEGIVVNSDFTLAIEKYRFRPNEVMLRHLKLDQTYIQTILAKYNIG